MVLFCCRDIATALRSESYALDSQLTRFIEQLRVDGCINEVVLKLGRSVGFKVRRFHAVKRLMYL